DLQQLTDGKTTAGYFWTQPGTVGWQSVRYASVTIDLGDAQPISGVSMTTAAGVAGVTWPLAVYVLVSDDGRAFYNAGDLAALDRKQNGPWPDGYAIRRLVTHELRTWGRYVQLMIVPLPGGPYLFTDEVEVFRGPLSLIDPPRGRGEPTDAQSLYEQGRLLRAVTQRLDLDSAALKKQIAAADLNAGVRVRLAAQVDAATAATGEPIAADLSFAAILPLNRQHAAMFVVQAELWKNLELPPLSASVPVLWDPLTPITVPQREPSQPITVHTMLGEYRASALNLANSTDQPLTVRLCFRDLPQSPLPPYVSLHEVQWTDTSQGLPVAAALPEARRTGDGWTVTVPPGLVRQVWMTWHVTDVPPGDYAGSVLAETQGQSPLEIPVRLKIWPLDFPQRTSLCLGGWSYTNSGGSRGVTPQNRAALVEHLQQRFVNAPWATGSVLRSFEFDRDDPQVIRLDTQALDEWISLWPHAKQYMVFLAVADYGGAIQSSLGGAALGSPEFGQRVGTWIKAWVAHLRGKGIAPDQLGLLIHDEPHEGSDIGPLLAWARAIRAAEPDVLVWEDPTYRNPAAAPPELFDACRVLCPNRPMWLEGGEPFAQFYRRQQADGRRLQFYSCSGPARLLDPYAYYRLQAWQCWQEGATGSFFWAFSDNGGASSWNEYFAAAGPFTPLFLDDTTVTAGKHMEAIRESAEDYEYFVMLREAVARARAAGRTDPAVTAAQTLLAEGARTVLSAPAVNQLRWEEPKDRTQADSVRVHVLQALTDLK
ncbi:MAG: hypothetical protein MUE50_11990, partial [Pirellulaceae bacterium]|nr:hypothetical protein [Pirellulaceae bacterium]